MKVRIGALELCDVSFDELDELIKRYGNAAIQPAEGGGDEGEKRHGSGHGHAGKNNGHGTTDMVILRKLVDAGSQGLPTADLGEMLGRRGKATRGAVNQWAHRMGIVSDPSIDAFEECRVGTQRGLRIKSSLMDIAKAHLSK